MPLAAGVSSLFMRSKEQMRLPQEWTMKVMGLAVALATGWSMSWHSLAEVSDKKDTGPPAELRLRGRIVCVGASGLQLSTNDCDQPDNLLALKTSEGMLYPILHNDSRAKMLRDPRVRARELEVTAWLRPGSKLETVKIYSVREGILHEIHYRCDVCNITVQEPGPCWCCQQEFELRETPKDKP